MKMDKGEAQFHTFLTMVRDVCGQLHAPVILMTGEGTPGIHWIGGWVGLRADLAPLEKGTFSSPCQEFKPNSSVVQPMAKSLYRLSCPSSYQSAVKSY
jgi:hypothetical protein